MRAARIHRFGPPEVIVVEDVPRPVPAAGELLVRVAAAGVAPWDAIIREGKSEVSPPPPLTLGSDLSGVVEDPGPDVTQFQAGDVVYGVTNPQFCGACAEYAIASANMVDRKPHNLSAIEAASVPVVAVTAWQMLFEYAHAKTGQSALILGAAGNVGAYAVQLAANAGLHVTAIVRAKDKDHVRNLGAENIIDDEEFEHRVPQLEIVIDTVGGETRQRSFSVLKAGGVLVSVVSTPIVSPRSDVQAAFFYAEVTTQRLKVISELFERGKLSPQVGSVLPLQEIQTAHRMLAGAPHKRGKIVLNLALGD